jgi:small subunit ribosomal protein S20
LANHKSAVKRNLQSLKRRLRNRSVKTRIKNVVKTLSLPGQEGDADTRAGELNTAISIIDKAAQKGVIHSRTAARKISRLTKRVSRMSVS